MFIKYLKIFTLINLFLKTYAVANPKLVNPKGVVLATCDIKDEYHDYDKLLDEVFYVTNDKSRTQEMQLFYNITCMENLCNYKNTCAPFFITDIMEEYCKDNNGTFNDVTNKKCLEKYSCTKNGGIPNELNICCSKYSEYEKKKTDKYGAYIDMKYPNRICKEPPPSLPDICCYRVESYSVIFGGNQRKKYHFRHFGSCDSSKSRNMFETDSCKAHGDGLWFIN